MAEIQDARQDLQFPWRAKGSICKVSQWYKDLGNGEIVRLMKGSCGMVAMID